MKAVVLEIRDNMAAVMLSDGQIIKVEDCGYRIGEEINVAVRSSHRRSSRVSAFKPLLIAASVLLVCFGAGSGTYLIPTGTVSLDVNPSIEYKINMFDRVLSVSGVNDDGKNILLSIEKSDVVGKSIETAVENTISEIRDEGYFSEDENYVVVTANTSAGRNADKLTESLSDTIDKQDDLSAIAKSVTKDDFEKAHSEGTTPGKIMVVDMLEEAAGEEIDRDTWMHSSVNNIMSEYNKRMGMKEPAEGSVPETVPEGEDQMTAPVQNEENSTDTEMNMPDNGEMNGRPDFPEGEDNDGSMTLPEDGNNINGEAPDGTGQNGMTPPSDGNGAPLQNGQPSPGSNTGNAAPPAGNAGGDIGAPGGQNGGMVPSGGMP